jgi:N-acetylglutamate synthase-like GNAT family acetyltransferase
MIRAMADSTYRVRRATQEDLAQLKELWASMQLPVEILSKQLTDFQVVHSVDGQLAGAVGIQILGPHARLHGESYRDFAIADELRPLLMERIRSLASNHGVFRLWTQESSPYWSRNGFQPTPPEILKKLPEAWAQSGSDWLTLQLKDEAALVSLEKEIALFMETEKQRTARAFRQVQTIKTLATWLAIVLAVFVLGAIAYVFLKNPGMLVPRSGNRP